MDVNVHLQTLICEATIGLHDAMTELRLEQINCGDDGIFPNLDQRLVCSLNLAINPELPCAGNERFDLIARAWVDRVDNPRSWVQSFFAHKISFSIFKIGVVSIFCGIHGIDAE